MSSSKNIARRCIETQRLSSIKQFSRKCDIIVETFLDFILSFKTAGFARQQNDCERAMLPAEYLKTNVKCATSCSKRIAYLIHTPDLRYVADCTKFLKVSVFYL